MKLISAGKTDVGRIRELNEDSLYSDEKTGLFMVCDGLGGHSAGEVASAMAVDAIKDFVDRKDGNEPKPSEGRSEEGERLGRAVEHAGRVICNAAAEDSSHKGMGSTATAALFHDGAVSIAQVGDSRAYRLKEGSFEQITQDHSLVAEQIRDGILTPDQAAKSPYRNIITRALGSADDTRADVYEVQAEAGDRYLLCSDGLTGVVSNGDIREVMASTDEPALACDTLVRMANDAGGPDNITVVLIYVLEA
jgi:protein phosphatase